MQNGILIYKSYNNNFNIGDYIQSIASSQYFDEIHIYLNRELLNTYTGKETKLIMNGWFMHEPQNWPPSKDIRPLFLSFHMNSVARSYLLNSESLKYLKDYEPIGCRDKSTADLLRSKGINAYFSGCLTLTLRNCFKSNIRTDSIYFVDPYFEITKNIYSIVSKSFNLIFNYTVIKNISIKLRESCSLKNLLITSFFYSTYSKIFDDEVLSLAEYIKHEAYETDFKSEDEKFELAKLLISKYAKAKLVVSSRIHCALPCLSLETPVLYLENVNQSETSNCRLDGLRELFHIISYCRGRLTTSFNIPSKKIGMKFIIKNKEGYKILMDKLIIDCQHFVNENSLDNE